MRSWQPTLMVNGEAERVTAVRVSANYFDMLGAMNPKPKSIFWIVQDNLVAKAVQEASVPMAFASPSIATSPLTGSWAPFTHAS